MSAPVTDGQTTLEYFDGFDDYNASQMTRSWTTVNAIFSILAAGGRNGTSSLYCSASSGGTFATITFTAQATRTVGVAFKTAAVYTGSSSIISFLDTAALQCDLRINADGTLSVTRNGTILGTSVSAVISANSWVYLEMSLTVHPSAGAYTVKANGATVISGTGANTRATANSSANVIALGTFTSGANNQIFYFDDFYSRSDGIFCGDVRVETKLPTGNGATDNFTPSAGSNWQNVDDNPATDDTDYNTSSAANDIDLYTYPALSTTAGSVQAVMVVCVMRNDAAGTVTAATEIRVGSTNYDGATQTVGSTTYNAYSEIYGQNPGTAAAWTIAGVNAAQFGVKRIA